jgi:hypothetical protein
MTLIVRPGFQFDTDASTYIEAVEVADAQALETATRYAINDFVIGCKQDGIWSAIKASCILSGARTTNGALVPLVGTAPTNFNFDLVGNTDYNRKTGLLGNGGNKYLNSNRAANADPQNSHHMATYRTLASDTGALLGNIKSPSWDILDTEGGVLRTFSRSQTGTSTGITGTNNITGFIGLSRSSSSTVLGRAKSQSSSLSTTSGTPVSELITVFARNQDGIPQAFNASRLAFYSIGESLDLALLDARVSALITAFGVAIP